eukprot:m.49806 g.49806  ORF g.49806 m.49806 type:complete len:331 (-) comp12501_c2_seq1:55-1047(-)
MVKIALLVGLLALASCMQGAECSVWFGMSPEPDQPHNISIFHLSGHAVRGPQFSSIILPHPNEHVAVDSFRCQPLGSFCMFTTSNGTDSWTYNISAATGALTQRTMLPEVEIHNLHIDMATGAAYTVALAAPHSAVITQITSQGVRAVIDISSYLQHGDEIPPAGTTQCSDVQVMWVGIRRADKTQRDVIVQVDLTAAKVVGVLTLQEPLINSLWASCNDRTKVNALGGIASLNANSQVAYGAINTTGGFIPTGLANMPNHTPPLEITGLLSEPVGYDYFFTLYAQGATPGGPATEGLVVFGDFKAPGLPPADLKFVPITYYLTGAALLD